MRNMPPKRKAAKAQSSGGSDDEEYRKKRDRNNQAVKRSRVKSKQRAEETNARVEELKVKNGVLEDNIDTAQKELKFLKELFLSQAQAKSDTMVGIDLKKLLADDYDEGPSGSGSGSSMAKS